MMPWIAGVMVAAGVALLSAAGLTVAGMAWMRLRKHTAHQPRHRR